jgi:hypothetical protein
MAALRDVGIIVLFALGGLGVGGLLAILEGML